ncbi:MAG: hypothetical protein JXA58_05370, partial [Dehalococcoidia bacterium]|nr:hypothetical protein [Dehalococcoidia bacterium]
MNARLEDLRRRMLEEHPSVDVTRARIVTEVHRAHSGEPMAAVWGEAMFRLFTELPVDIAPGELIVGSPTLRPRAAQLFPEVQSGWLDAELDGIETRGWDPLLMSAEDKREVRESILPYWKGRTIAERLFAQCPAETAPLIYLEPGVWPTRSTGVIDNYSLIQKGIGTVVPNYRKVVERGVNGILAEIDARIRQLDLSIPQDVDRMVFLRAARRTLEGFLVFARRYATLALERAGSEQDAARREELLRIHRACTRVPAEPPRNFHEAVQSFWFTHVAVRIEESGHSLSPGRFDQYMLPYLSDSEDRAEVLELLECLFIKFSELMLFVNVDTSKFYTGVPQWQNLNL